ncbi:MAG: transposase [Gammaproteobacteria bacterium]|nr:transposase [Gammaproteobacteria bacterium]
MVAADRGGEILSHTLPALNAGRVKEVLEPVLVPHALLVSASNRCYPPVAAALDIPHESTNASTGERVHGAVHNQTVNSRHSQIKGFLRGRRGIATKYLDSYMRWFNLIALGINHRPAPACRRRWRGRTYAFVN